MNPFTQFIKTSRTAEMIVSKKGVSARLVILAAAVMSFLLLYTVSLATSANSMAKTWRNAMEDQATVRLQAPAEQTDGEAAAIVEFLRTTPGVKSYREIETVEQLQLLEPWLGEDIPVQLLTLPKIFSVTIDPEQIDAEAVQTRLSAEAPNAIWDDHNRWRGPLLESARRISMVSWFSSILITAAFAIMIYLASEASVAANSKSIHILRQIGADDFWIRSGFERKSMIRSLIGSTIGVLVGLLAHQVILSSQMKRGQLVTGINFGDRPIFQAIIIVILCVALAFMAAKFSTARYLKSET